MFAEVSAPPALLSDLEHGSSAAIPASATSELREDRRSLIELLVRGGVDVSVRDGDGNSALHYAVQRGEAAIVELLLKNGADYEATNNDGVSPLLHATRLKRPEIALELLASRPPKQIDANL